MEDLVLGGGSGAEATLFYRPQDVAADNDGRIYVAEAGNCRIQVFDSKGTYIRSLGRRGDGPGEFRWPVSVEVIDDRILVSDGSTNRLSVWSLDGDLLADQHFSFDSQVFHMFGVSGDSLIVARDSWEGGSLRVEITMINTNGVELRRYGSLRVWQAPGVSRSVNGAMVNLFLPVATPEAWFVASRQGHIYLTRGDQYEVLALGFSGASRWALRVPWAQVPVTQEEINQAVEPYLDRFSRDELSRIKWPATRPALSSSRRQGETGRPLQLDGHGHLYVFPYIPVSWQSDERDRPVDVYSAEGERLFAGFIPNRSWIAAYGDYVYGIETDPGSEEDLVVRYRLVEPF